MDKQPLASRGERVVVVATKVAALGFGGYIPNQEIVDLSGYKTNTKQFGFFVSDVREVLVSSGMWLSGEGQNSEGFFVLRASENAVLASRYAGKAHRALLLVQTLLECTPQDTMSEAEKRRHDKELRELRYSNRIYARQAEVVEVLRKHKPGILKEDVEG